jgi:hypothetical protein
MTERRQGTDDHPGNGRRYRVEVEERTGWTLRRWRGRVVTVEAGGRRHHWPWRSGRSRQRLVTALWEDAMRDIEWRTGRRDPGPVVDPEAG